jgi:hypothetical protein
MADIDPMLSDDDVSDDDDTGSAASDYAVPENDPAFLAVLQDIVGLDTQPKRDRVTKHGGVKSADDLLLVDMDSLLACLTQGTSVMAKTKLKTLKLWVEEQYDLHGTVDITKFTADVCRAKQMKIEAPKFQW